MNQARKLIIRPMTLDDLPRIMEIENKVFVAPWTEAQFVYELTQNPVATVMVLAYADQVIGLVDFWITFDSATINQIAIDPDLQGKNLGTLIMEDTIARISGVDEVKTITLEVRTKNEKAINFYLKHHFDILFTKRNYYDNGDDAYYMARVIKE